MIDHNDKIICKGLTCECVLGFHDYEKKLKQKISIDFEVSVARPQQNDDAVTAIQLDYYKATNIITEFIATRQFNLIETVSDEIAQLLLEAFPIKDALIHVTKYPADMPHVESVTYQCYRRKEV
ncbi:MAG: dihydroneopterin aldolase [bacterium]|nr:dihydroneopterin aldolase [bacterium]